MNKNEILEKEQVQGCLDRIGDFVNCFFYMEREISPLEYHIAIIQYNRRYIELGRKHEYSWTVMQPSIEDILLTNSDLKWDRRFNIGDDSRRLDLERTELFYLFLLHKINPLVALANAIR